MMYARGQYVRIFDGEVVKIARPTLPELSFLKEGPPVDTEPERREVAARFAEHRTIKAGVECWQAIGKAESFEAWVKIGKALQIGRDYSLKTTGANRPMGQVYCRAFSAWLAKHEFTGIQKSVRSSALDLIEHLAEIEAWRLTLSEKRRRQLKHPLSNVAAWRKATQKTAEPLRHDPVKAAEAAWHRFTTLAKALPAGEARPLWQSVAAEATIHVS
jgi:hypothetical protein